MGRFSAWESVGYGALVDIVRMGRGLGQGGSVTGALGVAEVGVFGGNLGDYGDRLPLKDMFPVVSEQILIGSKFLR